MKYIIYKLFKDFLNQRKKTNKSVVFYCRPLTFLNTGTTDETFQQSGKQDPFGQNQKVQLVCIKVQAHISSETPLEYNQTQASLTIKVWL